MANLRFLSLKIIPLLTDHVQSGFDDKQSSRNAKSPKCLAPFSAFKLRKGFLTLTIIPSTVKAHKQSGLLKSQLLCNFTGALCLAPPYAFKANSGLRLLTIKNHGLGGISFLGTRLSVPGITVGQLFGSGHLPRFPDEEPSLVWMLYI